MFIINGSQAFWIFAGIEFGFLCFAIIASRLVSPKKPNPIKNTIYECGNEPFGEARSFRILGITKYFGYGVAFFALDAFAWVILTSAMSITITTEIISIIAIYTFVIFSGIVYFLIEKEKLVS
ncbi:MAG: NADH-quinone oxidoreductase subunit A [Candidatus Bathyarchaeota archaeon]|nr:NADH-quinone oxidoreductase subunit A [Candidatus Bathyarchaeota archaeon]